MEEAKGSSHGHGWQPIGADGFIAHVGPFFVRECEAGTRYGFSGKGHHANLLANIHGGMLMTFADRCLGLEAWKAADAKPCATLQFSMQFIKAVPVDTFVELVPRLLRRTRSTVFLDGTLFSGNDITASAHGAWKILGN